MEHLHGSIISALYAMGYDSNEMLNLFNYFGKTILERNPMYLISSMRENKSFDINGMRSGESIEVAINEAAKYRNMKYLSDLKRPIVISTVDMKSGNEYVFTNSNKLQGEKYIKNFEISKAVRASCSFPIYFAPFKHEGHTFIDGGVLNNIPVNEVKNLGADKIIGVNFFESDSNPKNNIYSIVLRTIDIMTNKIAENNLKESDYTININTGEVKILDMSKIKECYKIGYEETLRHIEEIKKIL